MPIDSDVVLLGTGIAPLIAASHYLTEGRSILLLNPDWDFFQEDSELPFDPLWPMERFSKKRLKILSPEDTVEILRPVFPGAIEVSPESLDRKGFHDPLAPHVRTRERIWLQTPQSKTNWSVVEDFYVETSDLDLKPRMLEELTAYRKFPGHNAKIESIESKAILLPKVSEVDVSRYRNGILEFIREKGSSENMIFSASQIEFTPEGIRYYSRGKAQTTQTKETHIFWTPKLSHWIFSQAKKLEMPLIPPQGVRLWEEYSLVSRDPLAGEVIGSFEDLLVWAEVEGAFPKDKDGLHYLSVLKAGALLNPAPGTHLNPLTAESFQSLSRLCGEFLRWESFTVRSMRPRFIFEWNENSLTTQRWLISGLPYPIFIVGGCDGPLTRIVEQVGNHACT